MICDKCNRLTIHCICDKTLDKGLISKLAVALDEYLFHQLSDQVNILLRKVSELEKDNEELNKIINNFTDYSEIKLPQPLFSYTTTNNLSQPSQLQQVESITTYGTNYTYAINGSPLLK